MKQHFAPRKARALAPLLVATALVSTPVFAQDTTPQTAPAQPAIVTPPATATVPIPPVVRTVPDAAPSTTSTTADEPAAKPARATTATRTATRTTRTVTHTRTASAARSAPAPAPEVAPAPAPQAAAPAPALVTPPADTAAPAPAPAAAPANEPAAPVADTASTQSNTTTTEVPFWAWIAGGIAVLAVILGAALAMRGRRREYEEPVYVEDTYVEPQPEPVAAAPVIAPVPVAKAEPRKEPEYLRRAAPVGAAAAAMEPVVAAPDAVEMSTPPVDEVAELTAGTAPVAERPWLEFAMRPVRAGTNVDEALVEIELTVGNSGSVPARDVRISTFLLSSDPNGTEMERLLLSPPSDATTDPVTIKPGEGKRIDATLALLKSDMGENLPDTIRPIIVADARYTLEDGTEGRTSASFTIGVTPEEGGPGLDPLELSRASMHENVGAELRGEPQHA
ncbi:hypothetical protein [Sphingomonas mali]|uniref:hypothetical protein n=1 Tax=Sphingomonas mali TaxID=40682 RepID=UPI00082B6AD6|nr:hypothetical protein [Sphingomonas mali]